MIVYTKASPVPSLLTSSSDPDKILCDVTIIELPVLDDTERTSYNSPSG